MVAPNQVRRRGAPPSAAMTYTSAGPSSRPVKATVRPSGEKRWNAEMPGFAVRRRADPYPASSGSVAAAHRSSSLTNTTCFPNTVG